MWTASLSQKTEVKQIGLDFPTQQRQSTCCEAVLQTAFDPRNLLIRMGQCVLHVFIGGSHKAAVFLLFLLLRNDSKPAISHCDSMKVLLFCTQSTHQPPHTLPYQHM